MKHLYKLLLLAASLFLIYRGYLYLTDDFRLGHITLDYSNRPEWEVAKGNTDFLSSQPFHYLAKGAQTYVFKSADGRYVIKFFKFKHVKPAWWDSDKQAKRKARKIERLFRGYLLAYNKNRDLSGLVYVQLNRGNDLGIVQVTDKLGFKHSINLKDFPFVVQKTGESLAEVLKKDQTHDQFNSMIGGVIDLYKQEYEKGLYDKDHRVMDNVGYAERKAIHLDIGMLVEDEKIRDREMQFRDLEKVLYAIRRWVQKKQPAHLSSSTIFIQDKVRELYNRPITFDKNYDEVLKHHP